MPNVFGYSTAAILLFVMCALLACTTSVTDDAYNKAESLMEKDNYSAAIEVVNKAIKLDPKSARAYDLRGRAYGGLGRFKETIDDCNRAINLDSKFAGSYADCGHAYGDLGQYQKTVDYCTQAIKLDPRLAKSYRIRGAAYGVIIQVACPDFCRFKCLLRRMAALCRGSYNGSQNQCSL